MAWMQMAQEAWAAREKADPRYMELLKRVASRTRLPIETVDDKIYEIARGNIDGQQRRK
jgi:hypothetical protein